MLGNGNVRLPDRITDRQHLLTAVCFQPVHAIHDCPVPGCAAPWREEGNREVSKIVGMLLRPVNRGSLQGILRFDFRQVALHPIPEHLIIYDVSPTAQLMQIIDTQVRMVGESLPIASGLLGNGRRVFRHDIHFWMPFPVFERKIIDARTSQLRFHDLSQFSGQVKRQLIKGDFPLSVFLHFLQLNRPHFPKIH